jgi:hypothetical protein
LFGLLLNIDIKSVGVKMSKVKRIKDKADLSEFIAEFCFSGQKYLFRGVKKDGYQLIPSVGRCKTNENRQFTVNDEIKMLDLFKQKAYGFIKEHINCKLELLAIAQHHGVPTRLLDWTTNPLTAIYFAVKGPFNEDELENDSSIFIFKLTKKANLEDDFNPFSIKETKRYIPRYYDPRIISQSGQFTVHPNPYSPFISENISKVNIDKEFRLKVKKALYKIGVHEMTIFPDLDGISTHIKWLRTNIIFC